MAKYEIMLVIRGDLDENKSKDTLNELTSVLKNENIKVTSLGLKDMAYEIKKLKKAWYYQLNFETTDQESLNEFKRLSRINKNLLRQLIINLEKDYGYKASINAKKIERNKKTAAITQKRNEERKQALENQNIA